MKKRKNYIMIIDGSWYMESGRLDQDNPLVNGTVKCSTVKKVSDLSNKKTAEKMYSYTFVKSIAMAIHVA